MSGTREEHPQRLAEDEADQRTTEHSVKKPLAFLGSAPRGWKRARWAVLPVAALLYLVPGPPKFADAIALPVVLTQARANGVTIDGTVRNALNRAAIIYDNRSDLQGVFGAGENLNVHALVEWAATRPDSSTTQLAPFESSYRKVLEQWSAAAATTPGVGVPTNGAPGLPGA